MNNHSAVVLPGMFDHSWIIVFLQAGPSFGASCHDGSLYLLFQNIPRNERNTNNGKKDIGFIAEIIHLSRILTA